MTGTVEFDVDLSVYVRKVHDEAIFTAIVTPHHNPLPNESSRAQHGCKVVAGLTTSKRLRLLRTIF